MIIDLYEPPFSFCNFCYFLVFPMLFLFSPFSSSFSLSLFSYLFSNPQYYIYVACYSPTPLHLPISNFLFFSCNPMFSLRYMDSEGRVKQLTAAVRAELLTVIDNMAKVSQLIACSNQDLYFLVTILFLPFVGSTVRVSLCCIVLCSTV